jgi:hypothetical protein
MCDAIAHGSRANYTHSFERHDSLVHSILDNGKLESLAEQLRPNIRRPNHSHCDGVWAADLRMRHIELAI